MYRSRLPFFAQAISPEPLGRFLRFIIQKMCNEGYIVAKIFGPMSFAQKFFMAKNMVFYVMTKRIVHAKFCHDRFFAIIFGFLHTARGPTAGVHPTFFNKTYG